ncbi:MAG: hypothetical protein CO133_02960, partial [Candidatus Komeilibacteria bacterium CG_4_9_14_3_um_filter_37_5]
MAIFTTKKIVWHQTVPEALKRAREQAGFDLLTCAKKLSIQVKYLEALEDGAYEQLPGEIYVRQWLRAYGVFLNLDHKWLIKEYQKERGVQIQFISFDRPEIKINSWLNFITPRKLQLFGLGLIGLAIFVYLTQQVFFLMRPPQLTVVEPPNNFITNERMINIIGRTEQEAEVRINDQMALLDQSGNFSAAINLAPGINILEIVAIKKRGQPSRVVISVMRQT